MRESAATGQPIAWNRVHYLPDYVYFNHSIHVNKGVGCTTCHGQVNEMPLTWKSNTLFMQWCLQCHREPEKSQRPLSLRFTAWIGSLTADQQERVGTDLVKAARTRHRAPDQLLGVPPLIFPDRRMNSDLEQFRARLAGQSGPQLWRSLEELGQHPGIPRVVWSGSFPWARRNGRRTDGGRN